MAQLDPPDWMDFLDWMERRVTEVSLESLVQRERLVMCLKRDRKVKLDLLDLEVLTVGLELTGSPDQRVTLACQGKDSFYFNKIQFLSFAITDLDNQVSKDKRVTLDVMASMVFPELTDLRVMLASLDSPESRVCK